MLKYQGRSLRGAAPSQNFPNFVKFWIVRQIPPPPPPPGRNPQATALNTLFSTMIYTILKRYIARYVHNDDVTLYNYR